MRVRRLNAVAQQRRAVDRVRAELCLELRKQVRLLFVEQFVDNKSKRCYKQEKQHRMCGSINFCSVPVYRLFSSKRLMSAELISDIANNRTSVINIDTSTLIFGLFPLCLLTCDVSRVGERSRRATHSERAREIKQQRH